MKKIFIILLSFVLVNVSALEESNWNKDNTPVVDSSEKIYDFADLFSDEEERDLKQDVEKYISEYNYDLVIVTIEKNDKGSAMTYADDFYDYNDFGIDSSNSGVLFLIDMDTRNIYISTTGNAIDIYTDSVIDSILDGVYTYMSDGKYYDGTKKCISKLSDRMYRTTTTEGKLFSILPYSFGGAGIITIITMVILVSKNKLARKATEASEFLQRESVKIVNKGDLLINTHTTKHRIETTSSSSGSSTHTGSSGTSHGGGGHSF